MRESLKPLLAEKEMEMKL